MFPCLVGHIVFTHCPLMDIWVVSPFSAPPFPKTVSEFQTWRAAVCRLLTQPAPWAEAVELDLGGRGRPESGRPSPGGGGAAPLQEHAAPSACTRGLWHWVASPRRAALLLQPELGEVGQVCCTWASRAWGPRRTSVQPLGLRMSFVCQRGSCTCHSGLSVSRVQYVLVERTGAFLLEARVRRGVLVSA